ncbi:hypothetical protein EGW08_016565, partial [Elysia chlorotica]
VYIHSAPGNLKKRQAVRQTWAHPTLLRRLDAAVIFLLGRPAEAREQELLDLEANEYGDLVQEDFLDAYRNLTYKGVSALRWVSLFCPSAVFLLKTDDDILVDIVSLVSDLRQRYPGYPPPSSQVPGAGTPNTQSARAAPSRVVLCNLWTRMKVMRDPKSKWFIPPTEFGPDYFPPYCSGSAFVLSADLAPRLYQVSLNKPFFWVDDYYVTGVLVNSLGVPHVRYNDVYLLNANLAESQLAKDTGKTLFFHVKKLALFLKLWPMLLRRHLLIPDLKDLMPSTHPTPSSIVGATPSIIYRTRDKDKHDSITRVLKHHRKEEVNSNTISINKDISHDKTSAHVIPDNKSENLNIMRKTNGDVLKYGESSPDLRLHRSPSLNGAEDTAKSDKVVVAGRRTLTVSPVKQNQYGITSKLENILKPRSSKLHSSDAQMRINILRGLDR